MNEIWNVIQCFYFNRMLEYGIPQHIAIEATNNWCKGFTDPESKELRQVFQCEDLRCFFVSMFFWHHTEQGSKYWQKCLGDLTYLDEMWNLVDEEDRAKYSWGVWSAKDSQSLQPRISKQHRPG